MYIYKYTYIFDVIFFKKTCEVICIINFKNTLFKGLTRGGPWAPSLVKQNLNRTLKCKVIAVKKKKTFKDVTRVGPWVSPFMKQKLNRTQKHEAFTA
jgi:hypothetical protein